jgi:hypothetical protein
MLSIKPIQYNIADYAKKSKIELRKSNSKKIGPLAQNVVPYTTPTTLDAPKNIKDSPGLGWSERGI